MRRGVVLGSAVALVLALPAAARVTDETVTIRVGQTVPLKTVFDETKTYTIVMSGLVTLTLKDGTGKEIYDPFHGMQGANCERAGPGVYLQIEDARGGVIDFADADRPRCRSDHRYVFQVNDGVVPQLVGRAKAYIPLQPDLTYWTVSGSFTLEIAPPARRDVRFSVLAKKELLASRRDPDLADARLGGAGVVVDLDGAKDPRGAFSLTVVWLQEDDWHLVLRPTGNWFYNATRRSVSGYVEVVKSDAPACKKGFDWRFAVRQSAGRDAVATQPRACRGLGELAWREPASSIVVKVTEVKRT